MRSSVDHGLITVRFAGVLPFLPSHSHFVVHVANQGVAGADIASSAR